MYEVLEVSLADTSRLFRYHREGVFGAQFNLKGFAYPWLVSSRSWARGERVLDVGGGYSDLPVYLANSFGCEVWVVDDFGMTSGEPFWTRRRDPYEHARAHPEVRFSFERVGDPRRSSLPAGAFDCVYSLSTLEHVPAAKTADVWSHMDHLLRPGGEMLHSIDLGFPVQHGLASLLKAMLIDATFRAMPAAARRRYIFHTPRAYARFVVCTVLRSPLPDDAQLAVNRMVFDPEVIAESMENTYNRMVKDGMTDVRHGKTGTLLLRLRKLAERSLR